jgi:hypothetical protein
MHWQTVGLDQVDNAIGVRVGKVAGEEAIHVTNTAEISRSEYTGAAAPSGLLARAPTTATTAGRRQ